MTSPRKRARPEGEDPFCSPTRNSSNDTGSDEDEQSVASRLQQKDLQYYAYILSKLPIVASIVIGLRRGSIKSTVISLEQTVQTIVDSVRVGGYNHSASSNGLSSFSGTSFGQMAANYKVAHP